jgi:hypothetical protein
MAPAAYPDNTTKVTNGDRIRIAWSVDLSEAISQSCPGCDISTLDLWTDVRPRVQIAGTSEQQTIYNALQLRRHASHDLQQESILTFSNTSGRCLSMRISLNQHSRMAHFGFCDSSAPEAQPPGTKEKRSVRLRSSSVLQTQKMRRKILRLALCKLSLPSWPSLPQLWRAWPRQMRPAPRQTRKSSEAVRG